jgi:hypothetical protein
MPAVKTDRFLCFACHKNFNSIGLAILRTAVSHIPQFGDANTSLAGDAASPAGDVDVSAGDAHL